MDLAQTKWVGYRSTPAPGDGAKDSAFGAPPILLRKRFFARAGLESASLAVTSLGVYRAMLNGKQVGNDYFTPGWTDYNVRIAYQTYDVTDLVRTGENVIGATVADGWYMGQLCIFGRDHYSGYPLRLGAVLTLRYADGEEIVSTGEGWEASTGKIVKTDFLHGERIDDRLEKRGFFTAEYDGGDLYPAEIFDAPAVKYVPMREPPARVKDVRKPEFLHRRGESDIYDVGQNMVGIVTAELLGDEGTEVRFRFGEMLNDDGTLYTANLRSAEATDAIVLRGGERESFSPIFTFHGFRYVEITVMGKCEIENLEAKVIYSDLRRTGEFSCSDPIVNKVYENAFWGQRGNFVCIPTDCPQRDERLGWTGDAEVFCMSGCYNMDAEDFYRSYLDSCRDAAAETGAVTDVVPFVHGAEKVFGRGSAAWADAMTVIPWKVYLMYGNREIAEENLPAMKRWVRYLVAHSEGYIRRSGIAPDSGFGDWLSVGEETDRTLVTTAFFAYSALLTARLAELLGDSDAEKYRWVYERVREAFRKEFLLPDGRLSSDTETAYVLGYRFGILSADEARDNLLRRIEANGGKLTTGFVGVSFLLPVLSDLGCSEVAYRLMCETGYPSWGYSVVNGATTIWERWNSWTKEKGFADIAMNSFNHYSLGSCVEWMYGYMLGIRPSEERPGFARTVLAPDLDFSGKVTRAKGAYDSRRGRIAVEWRTENGECFYEATFPEGADVAEDFSRYEVVSLDRAAGRLSAVLRRK